MKNTITHPYWHVDLKWLLALLALPFLATVLLLTASYRLTAKEPAVDILSYTLAGLTSSEGIDSDFDIEQLRQDLDANEETVVAFGGVNVTITAEDLDNLSPREIRLKIFSAFAERFYDVGAGGVAEDISSDTEAIVQIEDDAVLISPLTSAGHRQIGVYLAIATVIALALLSMAVLFSYRLGRLVTPGVLLLLAGLPGILFMAIAASNPNTPSGTIRSETGEGSMELAGNFVSFMAPLIMPYLSSTYMSAFLLGVTLLVLALMLKIILKHRDKENG
ncbi:MAG: hypothetical protein WD467_00280 [Candidatus Saccharimonadales bacterium]